MDTEDKPDILDKVHHDDSGKNTKGCGKGRSINYHVEMFRVDLAGKTVQTTEVSLGTSHVSRMLIYQDANKNLVCPDVHR